MQCRSLYVALLIGMGRSLDTNGRLPMAECTLVLELSDSAAHAGNPRGLHLVPGDADPLVGSLPHINGVDELLGAYSGGLHGSFQKQGPPKWTPMYYDPSYKDFQKGPLFWKPSHDVNGRLQCPAGCLLPGKPVACNSGQLSMNYGLR